MKLHDLILKGVAAVLFAITLMVPTVGSAQTGDSVIDGWLSGFQRKGGNSSPPGDLHPNSYGGVIHKCNSPGAPSWEGNCPSDLLYTPNHWTGGYQAYGVGLNLWPGGYYWYRYCYPVWVYYEEYGWQLEIWCDYYLVQVTEHTYGAAAARITFGATNAGSSPWGPRPMSTMAFKGNNVYAPVVGEAWCTPVWLGSSAPCYLQSDKIAVPASTGGEGSSVGYEDKIIIQDNNCNVTVRTDTYHDANNGCFTRDGGNWATDLPSPYPDTTKDDGPTPYISGIGTAAPTSLIEGQRYFWWINFYQMGLEAGTGHHIGHNAAITYKINSAPGCSSSALWNCYFNVDQTTIAPSSSVN